MQIKVSLQVILVVLSLIGSMVLASTLSIQNENRQRSFYTDPCVNVECERGLSKHFKLIYQFLFNYLKKIIQINSLCEW